MANGSKSGRCSPLDMTLYKSLGIAPQDLGVRALSCCRRRARPASGRSLTSRDGPRDACAAERGAGRVRARAIFAPLRCERRCCSSTPKFRASIIFLKLENLQPWGSFKIRPAVNTLKTMDAERCAAAC